MHLMKYCSLCGAEVKLDYVDGDNRKRFVCTSCQTIHYTNPKVVVGALVHWGDQVLLCKRAIEPRYGYWNLPAGYLEDGEKSEDGAARESLEAALVSEAEIPWNEMAFTSSYFALKRYFEDKKSGKHTTHLGTFPEK